jgi:long-chain acyl-CoA synthetase
MSKPKTLVHWVGHWATEKPNKAALWFQAGGGWKKITWKQYNARARAIASGLIALGHKPKDPVSIVGSNRPDWVLVQMGVVAAGGIPAPIYPTSTEEQTAYIIKHAGVKICVLEDKALLDKHLACIDKGLMEVDKLITMDKVDIDDDRVISLAEVEEMGKSDDPKVDERLDAIEHDDIALLIFTSGTTGLPKGAELTHAGIDVVAEGVAKDYPEFAEVEAVGVSYLPLSHVAEQIFTNFFPLTNCGEVYFCQDLKKISNVLTEARPTIFLAVPRVWEKFEAVLRTKLGAATGIKAKLTAWAMKTELEAFSRGVREDRDIDTFGRRIANKLIISKVKGALGFDRMMGAVSGAAPIAISTLEFFASLGIVIHEGYGMTETTGVATGQKINRPRFGTVGRALSGVEIKIAEDGEIMLKGKNMTRGYFKLPDMTEELYTGEWLHTGDIGELDNDGYLKITGRKKDLIITAGGKNVAPAEIEQHLAALPGVGQSVVVGDRQPYLTALLALDPEAFESLGEAAGSSAKTIAELAKCKKVEKFVQGYIDENCNPKLAPYQTVKRFSILTEAFSIESGELTPTMKVKRNVVNEKYASVITTMYEGGTLNTPDKSARA